MSEISAEISQPITKSVEVNNSYEKRVDVVADFLNGIVSEKNQKSINERKSKINQFVLEPNANTITVETNGIKKEIEFPSSAATRIDKFNFIEGTTYFNYAVYLRNGMKEHNIDHEYFHALSASLRGEKINQDNYASKLGLVRYYDESKDGNLLVSKTISIDGDLIDEGVAEYLTFIKDNEDIYGSPYFRETIMAQFLIGSQIKDNDLINAYVSDTVRDIEIFEQKFNESQSNFKYKDLSNKDIVESNNFKYLLGAIIDFRLSTDNENEKSFYINLINEMEENSFARRELELKFDDDFEPMMLELKKHIK